MRCLRRPPGLRAPDGGRVVGCTVVRASLRGWRRDGDRRRTLTISVLVGYAAGLRPESAIVRR